MAVPDRRPHDIPLRDDVSLHDTGAPPGPVADPATRSAAAAKTIAELEQRVLALEVRLRLSETERDELARACRDARDAQRVAEASARAREEILAIVTHDLRNPLGTIVMGATALVQLGAPGDPTAQRIRTVAERIQRQAERMTHQLGNLSDFADIQAGRFVVERTPHAPDTIVAAAREAGEPIARERGVGFEARTAPELPAVDCDAARVVQALSNLIANALKVTARGGMIEIGAVRDAGPGLDPHELGSLFVPGPCGTHPGHRGTGLGFTIARGIVDAHGGRIWAERASNGGTTIYFSLSPSGN